MTPLVGTFAATGQSQVGEMGKGDYNLSLWGTFVATVQLERSYNGTTWLPLTALGTSIAFTGACTEVLSEPEAGLQYRLNCTSYTSGTVNYRLSQ